MNTTNLFVELLVIGLGPVAALGLIVLVALGPDAGSMAEAIAFTSSLGFVIPALGVMYVLGIVTDRVADRIFGLWSRGIRVRHFDSDAAYHEARRTIIMYSEMLYGLRQYGRSRMRIARGWAFNSVLLLVPLNLWAAGSPAVSGRVAAVMNGALLALLLGSIYSWNSLTRSEYRKIQGGAAFIRRELNQSSDDEAGMLEAANAEASPDEPADPVEG